MTISPKLKKELHSAAVTFITVFIGVAVPVITTLLKSGDTKTISEIMILLSPALRAGIKAVYQLLINDYTKDDQSAI